MSFRDLWGFTAPPLNQEHPIFGAITYTAGKGWESEGLELWGFHDVYLMIDAEADGPTPLQEAAFVRLRDSRDTLLPRCLALVDEERARTAGAPGVAFVTAVSVPALGGSGLGQTGDLWTLWFDYEGEEHWSFGVQSTNDWRTLAGFAED